MAKLDRLGWADGTSFTAYGVRVGLRVNDAAILNDLVARLPPGAKPSSLCTSIWLSRLDSKQGRVGGRDKGVLELLANTVSARSQPELALSVLPKALESARIVKGVRGEASEVLESILCQNHLR